MRYAAAGPSDPPPLAKYAIGRDPGCIQSTRASGSDGLSSIATEDMTYFHHPAAPDAGRVRTAVEQRLKDAHTGNLLLPRMVSEELAQPAPAADIPLRSSHTAQV